MIDCADTKSSPATTAALKHAAMAGSALALVVGIAAPAGATVINTSLGSPITLTLNTASSAVFDINNDSIVDYTLTSSGGCSPVTICSISVTPAAGNKVYADTFLVPPGITAARQTWSGFQSNFYMGNPFKYMTPNTANLVESLDGSTTMGKWTGDGSSGILGLEFAVGGKDYLGYIHGSTFDPAGDTSLNIVFHSYGYESKAVPETDTLSLLAMGMVGLGALRRRRKAVKA